MDEDGAQVSVKPAWLAPVFVVSLVVMLVIIGKKKDEAVENPIVDAAVITVLVFAMAAVFRKLFSLMDAPGAVAFFGGPVQPHPEHHSTVDTAEGY